MAVAVNTTTRTSWQVPIWLWQTVVFALVGLLWQLGSAAVDKETFPSLTATIETLGSMLGESEFWGDVRDTTTGWAIGLSLAIVFGMSLGLTLGRSDYLTRSTRGTLDFLRSIPGVALLFIFLGILSLPWRTKIGIVTFAAGWPIAIQSMYGARAMSATLHDFSSAYRIPSRDRLLKLAIPSAMPFIITGIRLAASVALVVNIAAEYWVGAPGLGRRVIPAKEADDYPRVFALILVAGLLGVILNRLVLLLDRKVLAWHPSNRKEST